MKSFKHYIMEDSNSKIFNSFVENTLTNNKINPNAANDFLNEEYNYKGIIYRVRFFPVSEIQNLFTEDNEPDKKAIASYLVQYFNPNQYVFFSKTLRGILNLIKFPLLFHIDENQIGIIFSQKSNAAIELSKYSGKNIEVKKRLDQTQEVLSFEDLTITNISALYYFGESGWVFETDLSDRPIIIGNQGEQNTPDEDKPEETEEPQKEQPEQNPTKEDKKDKI